MTARQVLELATIKSAQCFGLDRRIGSLTPGKEADIVLLRKTDINMRAAADPISAIVLHAGVANVDTVIVGGNIVKQNGKLTYRDLSATLAELERSSKRLYERFCPTPPPLDPLCRNSFARRSRPNAGLIFENR